MNDQDEARRALEDVALRRQQVVALAMIPAWYWWAIASLMIVLGVVVDSKRHVEVGVGTSVFVVGILTSTAATIIGRFRSAEVRGSLLAPRGIPMILGFVAAVVGVTLVVAFTLRSTGSAHPGAIGCAAGGLLMVAGGPLLMRSLRRVMLRAKP